MTNVFREEASREWDQARRKAFWMKLRAFLTGKDIQLRDFNYISSQLHLRNPRYRGLQDIPLNKIVGSVGRYYDFIDSFLPVTKEMESRWERIAALYLNPVSSSVPPIEVYKVGDSYFVKDGNHRVSVANQLGLPTIEAFVWEYPPPVEGLSPDADIDTMLLEMEKQDFFEDTQLDKLRPNHNIRVTLPGGYRELQDQIAGYRKILSEIDGVEVSHEDGVTGWYDLYYEPSVQIIEQSGILEHYPQRTATDLFIWVHRQRERLEERYGHSVMLTEAIEAADAAHRSLPKRLWNSVRRWMKT